MAGRGSGGTQQDVKPTVKMLGVALCSLVLASFASAEAPAPSSPKAPASVVRQRRSDDYDNMDNFLMGSSDYDNFFLKTAKSVPRIGRRSGASSSDNEQDQPPVHVDRRSTDINELVPSYAQGYDHFFLKASKSVPRIGKRNDEFFMKTAKSVPRIGRRSGEGPDQVLRKGADQADFLKAGAFRPRRFDLQGAISSQRNSHPIERRSRLQVEDGGWSARTLPGGNDAGLGQEPTHRIQRRNYDELMAKAAKTVPRMGKRMHPTLDEVGDWGTEQQWPWFRQDTSPGPAKRANKADFIDLRDVPWESLDLMLRTLEAQRGHQDGDKHGPDVVLLEAETGDGDKWMYEAADKKDAPGNKELEEARFQPDVRKRK